MTGVRIASNSSGQILLGAVWSSAFKDGVWVLNSMNVTAHVDSSRAALPPSEPNAE
jgi:hypothetical protein